MQALLAALALAIVGMAHVAAVASREESGVVDTRRPDARVLGGPVPPDVNGDSKPRLPGG